MIELKLAPRQQALYDLLADKGDVDINHLYACYFGRKPKIEVSPIRYAQLHMGPPIHRLNRKLRPHGKVIAPGQIKGSYRLVTG